MPAACLPHGPRLAIARPSQHGSDPRRKLPGIERFGHVVVCTEFDADNPVDLVTFGRQHDDRRGHACPQPAADRQSVFPTGQHDVQNDQAGLRNEQGLVQFLAVPGAHRIITIRAQVGADEIADLVIVFHHKDQAPGLHAVTIGTSTQGIHFPHEWVTKCYVLKPLGKTGVTMILYISFPSDGHPPGH